MEGRARFSTGQPGTWINLDDGTVWKVMPEGQGHPLILSPRQSAALIFGPPTQGLPVWSPERPQGHRIDLSAEWEVQLAGAELDHVWSHKLSRTTIELPLLKVKSRSFQKWENWTSRNYPDEDWKTVATVRGQALSTEPTPLLFRAVLPPGTRSIGIPLPINGEYALWYNGSLLEKSIRRVHPPAPLELPSPSRPGDVLAIETISHAGPAGIERPLQLRCGPIEVDQLRSWHDWGFGHYCGRVLYRKIVSLESNPGKVWLDLGKVEHYVEVWINQRQAGLMLWPPYTLDITAHCHPGRNEVVLVVANSIANRFAWDIWGTRGSAQSEPSGLLGPVFIYQQASANLGSNAVAAP
jgi:hypothetical protein